MALSEGNQQETSMAARGLVSALQKAVLSTASGLLLCSRALAVCTQAVEFLYCCVYEVSACSENLNYSITLADALISSATPLFPSAGIII